MQQIIAKQQKSNKITISISFFSLPFYPHSCVGTEAQGKRYIPTVTFVTNFLSSLPGTAATLGTVAEVTMAGVHP